MKSRFLAVALACGVLAVPAVALASSGDGRAPSTTPVQQQEQQQPDRQDGQRPDGHDCPEPGDRGPGDGAPEGEAPEGGGGDTLL
jgi:hypothetical protein